MKFVNMFPNYSFMDSHSIGASMHVRPAVIANTPGPDRKHRQPTSRYTSPLTPLAIFAPFAAEMTSKTSLCSTISPSAFVKQYDDTARRANHLEPPSGTILRLPKIWR